MDRSFSLAAQGELQALVSLLAENSQQLQATDSRGRTLLHVAAEYGQLEVVKHLIDEVASFHLSLDIKDNEGNTSLHLAVLSCHVEVVDLLLSSGATAVVRNSRRMLPLHTALQNKNCPEMVTIFTKYDAIDHRLRGFRDYTALHIVAAANNVKALTILCEANQSGNNIIADILQVQIVDRDGLTPIHLAARKGSYDVLDFMISKAIEHGYQPKKMFEFLSEKESSPLHYAIESNSLESVNILLKHGASPTIASGKQGPPIHFACSQNKLNMVKSMVEQCGQGILNYKNEQGQTPLHSCVSWMGGKQMTSFLLSQGSLLDPQDANGCTPLQVAVQLGNVASIEELLARGSSPLIKNASGCNCLHIAVMFKREKVLKHLLEHPCCTEMCDTLNDSGDLPIHLALCEGLSSFVTPLLNSTSCQATDKTENNYIHLAALAGDERTIETILDYPFAESMINGTNSDGMTPLHCSAISGNLACISLLLNHGAVVNKCHIGRTPFMCACSKGKLQSAKVLYEAHPFQRDWTDDQGNTALHLAASRNCLDITLYCLDLEMVITLNNEQNSFFDIIIKALHTKLAEAVLQHKRWEECLDTVCPTKPHPIIRLINFIPSAFQIILDQSMQQSSLNPQHPDYWEKYNFKYISLQLAPTPGSIATVGIDDRKKKNKTKKGSKVSISAYNGRARVKQSNSEVEVRLHIEPFSENGELGDKHSELANLHLEAAKGIVGSPSNSDSIPLKMEEKVSQVQAIATDISNNQTRQNRQALTMQVLNLLIKKNMAQCLTHPVISKYLYLKWVDYARYIYLGRFLLILLLAIFLSTFIGLAPLPSQGVMVSDTGCENRTLPLATKDRINTAANVIRFLTVFFATLNAVIWLVEVYIVRLKIITRFVEEFDFWVYGCAIISTFVYLIPFHGINSVIYEAGAIAIFAIWFVALLQMTLFSICEIGTYVTMFLSTTKNVLKVLVICLFLFFAFAFSFYILVGSFSELQFTSVGTSLVSTLSSALAIIDLNTFVELEFEGLLRFRVLTFILYVLMLIILPIVVINLLIGLAVGDIAKIQEEAEITRQMFVVTNLKKIDKYLLPQKLLLKFCRKSYTCRPNATPESQISRMLKFVKEYVTDDNDGVLIDRGEVNIEETAQEEEEEELLALQHMKHQVDQLTQTQAKQAETMARMELMLQKLIDHQGLKYE